MVLTLLSLSESYFTFRLIVHYDGYPWLRKILINISDYGTWGLLIPFIYSSLPAIEDFNDRRFQILSSQFFYLILYLSIHILFSSILMYTPLYLLQEYPFHNIQSMPFYPDLVLGFLDLYVSQIPQELIARFIEYAVISGVFIAFNYYQKYQRKTLEMSKMEVELSNARLNALKAQLNPHFLFNALNSISALIDQNGKSAQTMISRLAGLLRQILYEKPVHLISLQQELDYVKSYLDIEEVRFGDRMNVVYKMDGSTLDHKVPSLMLQPLVENAVKHGFSKTTEMVEIQLSSWIDDDKLIIEVKDNGKGVLAENINTEGVGLKNLEMRLEQLYGAEAKFELISLQKGVAATAVLPIPKIDTA